VDSRPYGDFLPSQGSVLTLAIVHPQPTAQVLRYWLLILDSLMSDCSSWSNYSGPQTNAPYPLICDPSTSLYRSSYLNDSQTRSRTCSSSSDLSAYPSDPETRRSPIQERRSGRDPRLPTAKPYSQILPGPASSSSRRYLQPR
jgi:hypothetical protein